MYIPKFPHSVPKNQAAMQLSAHTSLLKTAHGKNQL